METDKKIRQILLANAGDIDAQVDELHTMFLESYWKMYLKYNRRQWRPMVMSVGMAISYRIDFGLKGWDEDWRIQDGFWTEMAKEYKAGSPLALRTAYHKAESVKQRRHAFTTRKGERYYLDLLKLFRKEPEILAAVKNDYLHQNSVTP